MSGAPFSTTFRWGAYPYKDAQGLINHDVREPGVEQTNPEVDPDRRHLNELLIADPETGELRAVRRGESPASTVRRRLDAVLKAATPDTVRRQIMTPIVDEAGEIIRNEKGRPVMRGIGEYEVLPKARRKDAAVMAEFVLELDGEFTGTGYQFDEDGEPIWERDEAGQLLRDEKGDRIQKRRTVADMSPEEQQRARELLTTMAVETMQQFPTMQWLYLAVHWDETHPHIQMAAVPTTEDGRVAWSEVLTGPKTTKTEAKAKLSARHDRMREALREAGYDATFERVDGPRRALPLAEHKKKQAQERREASRLADERDRMAQRERAAREQEAKLGARAAVLDDRAEELDAEAEENEQRRAQYVELLDQAQAAKEAAKAAQAAAEADRAQAAKDRKQAAEDAGQAAKDRQRAKDRTDYLDAREQALDERSERMSDLVGLEAAVVSHERAAAGLGAALGTVVKQLEPWERSGLPLAAVKQQHQQVRAAGLRVAQQMEALGLQPSGGTGDRTGNGAPDSPSPRRNVQPGGN